MIKPGIRRRLLILLVAGLVLACGLGGMYFYRRHQFEAFYTKLRADGLRAAQAGDHTRVVQCLEPYLPRYPNDIEPLVAYVKSRPLVVEQGNAQLTYTIVAL